MVPAFTATALRAPELRVFQQPTGEQPGAWPIVRCGAARVYRFAIDDRVPRDTAASSCESLIVARMEPLGEIWTPPPEQHKTFVIVGVHTQ